MYLIKNFFFSFFLYLSSFNVFSQNYIELNKLAYEQIEKGNLDSGLYFVNIAIQKDSTFFGSYYNRGIIYRDRGEFKLAINDFTKSIKYNPLDIDSYMNRGSSYFKILEFSSAINDFNNVIKIDSLNKAAFFNIGLIQMNLKDYVNAEISFIKSVQIDLKYDKAIFYLAKIYLLNKNFKESFDKINECILINDNESEYFEIRGVLYFIKGDNEKGCKDMKRANEIGELSPPALEMLKNKFH
ncbi:MAG: tetratricopeptide repeat protein [Fluviicola sp.]